MKVLPSEIPGVVLIEPQVFEDHRGCFLETYRKDRYLAAGIPGEFVQDNHSRSGYGALRGLHYQIEHPQGKLCWVVAGEVFDVAVDLRRSSPTFGRWNGVRLSAANRRQIYLPPGLAHGFCVVSELAEFVYKCSDYYHPEDERTLLWNDPDLAIHWPIDTPLLSDKDRRGLRLAQAPCYE